VRTLNAVSAGSPSSVVAVGITGPSDAQPANRTAAHTIARVDPRWRVPGMGATLVLAPEVNKPRAIVAAFRHGKATSSFALRGPATTLEAAAHRLGDIRLVERQSPRNAACTERLWAPSGAASTLMARAERGGLVVKVRGARAHVPDRHGQRS
jgi:hypothetical protein